MIVCIDSNVLLPMTASAHPWRCILEAWLQGRFTWAISNEVLTEYEEVMLTRNGAARWQKMMTAFTFASQLRDSLRFVHPSFRFSIISADPDDNKFIDCAIAAEADWIITEDAHFAPLLDAGYKPKPIKPDEFIARFIADRE